jgi:hypothetical protein
MKIFRRFKELDLLVKQFYLIFGTFFLFIFALIVVEFIGIFGISFGNGNFDATGNIPTTGGIITVFDSESDIVGLSLSIPANAYSDEIEVEISTTSVEDVNLANEINPITPIINIDNGHEYSDEAMTLTIPIDIDITTEYAMAFFYYEEDDSLEAIPPVSLSNTELVIQTHHFSSIIVSYITLDDLINKQASNSWINTGYSPGVDDWQFTNYGSSLAPNGHCAGQTLTSAYYYLTRTSNGEDSLWGLYDNDTTDFWYDDTNAYRYASVIQDAIDFTNDEFIDFIDYSINSELKAYNAFLYAMYVTGNPQFMAIYSHDDNDDIVSGHAILAYRSNGGKIYVADPNFPGQTERYITYSLSAGFSLYNSGDNANDISDVGTIQYDTFVFIGLGALVDFDILEQEYLKLLDGTVGNYEMPTLELDYMETYSYNLDDIVWTSVETPFIIPADYNTNVPSIHEDKLVISGTVGNMDAVYTIFKGDQFYKGNIIPESNGYFAAEIGLVNGVNHFGVLVEIVIDGYLYYADYVEFEYTYEGQTAVVIDPYTSIIDTYYFSYSDPAGSHTAGSHFLVIWDDGTFTESYWVGTYNSLHNGTWELEIQDDGSYHLILTAGTVVDIWYVSEDFNTLMTTGTYNSYFVK